MQLASKILSTDEIETVYSDPNFPQFNVGRNTKRLIRDDLPRAKAVDQSKLSEEDRAELNAAIAEAERVLSSTIAVDGEAEAGRARLIAILQKIGEYEPAKAEKESSFGKAMVKLSLWLYKYYGTSGYTQMPLKTVQNLFELLNDILNKIFSAVKI